jgi:REP element-mobilizing transposase RayT
MSEPVAYLITFRTYGTWLHGDKRGSVDDDHNAFNSPMLSPNAPLRAAMVAQLKHKAVTLNARQRRIVEQTVDEVCRYRDWTLHARQARSNHVHILVSADASPEYVMGSLKSWCSRRLREQGVTDVACPIWSRHGSTKYLWNDRSLREAGRYVLEAQGNDLP